MARYVTKYINKSENKSEFLKSIYSFSKLNSIADHKKIIHKIIIKTVGNRDISSQESCYVL